MSIQRDQYNGPIAFLCDSPKCPEIDETHCSDFGTALAKLKSHGWTVVKEREWRHYCRDCSK